MKAFLCILFAICFRLLYSQNFVEIRQKVYGSNNFESPSFFGKTNDGGYIMCSNSEANTGNDKLCSAFGSYDIWVLKLDSNLNMQWNMCYGGNKSDGSRNIIETSTGFLIFASSLSGISGNKTVTTPGAETWNTHIWIIETNKFGVITSQKAIAGSQYASIFDVVEYNGGYLICGSTKGAAGNDQSEDSKGGNDYWILYLDQNLNKIWDKVLGGSSDDSGYLIKIYNDDIYVAGVSASDISGNKSEAKYADDDFWILKLNSSGNVIWDKTIGAPSSSGVFSNTLRTLFVNSSGIFVGGSSDKPIGGTKNSAKIGLMDCWITKISHDGQIILDKTIGGNKDEYLSDFVSFNDNFSYLSATTFSSQSGDVIQSNFGGMDVWVSLVDNDLNVAYSILYGGTSNDVSNGLLNDNKNLLIAASSSSGVSGNKTVPKKGQGDIWLIELEPQFLSNEILSVEQHEVLYPNPSSGLVNLSNHLKYDKYDVINMVGKVVQSGFASNQILLEKLADGIYFIRMVNESKQVERVYKVVLQK